MSSYFFGASESYSQPAGFADQDCEVFHECLCYQVHSEPCEVLTPELDIPSSIPQAEEMQESKDYSKLAQNILSDYDAVPTQNQRVLRSASKKRRVETPINHEKPRSRSVFRSRKTQSRGSSTSRTRPHKSDSRSKTRKSSASRRARC